MGNQPASSPSRWEIIDPEKDLAKDKGARAKKMYTYMHKTWQNIELKMHDDQRLHKRWAQNDNFCRGIYRIFIVMCLIASTLMSTIAGITTIPAIAFIAAGLTAIGILKQPIKKILITEFTTRKRNQYRRHCSIRNEYLDKMFSNCMESIQDGKLTNEEFEEYTSLIRDMNEKLLNCDIENKDELENVAEISLQVKEKERKKTLPGGTPV